MLLRGVGYGRHRRGRGRFALEGAGQSQGRFPIAGLSSGQVDHLSQLTGGVVERGDLLAQPGLHGLGSRRQCAQLHPLAVARGVAVGQALGFVGRLEAIGQTRRGRRLLRLLGPLYGAAGHPVITGLRTAGLGIGLIRLALRLTDLPQQPQSLRLEGGSVIASGSKH